MFEPTFKISNQILINIGKIEAAKAVIDTAPLIPAWEKTFREEAQLRTLHYGTHLEGNDLTLGQAKLIFEQIRQDEHGTKGVEQIADRAGVVARDRDIQEIMNYRKVLDYVDGLRENTQRFTRYLEDEMMKIHLLTVDKILPNEQAGSYRTAKVVVKDAASGEVTFTPPNPVEVPFQVEHFLEWLNSFIHQAFELPQDRIFRDHG